MSNPAQILVKDFMRPPIVTFQPGTSLDVAVKSMLAHNFRSAPVTDENRQLVGYITQHDCLKQVLNDSYHAQEHAVVGDVMSKEPLTVSPNDDIVYLAQQMLLPKPKQYAVVDDDRLVGVITRGDILRALSQKRLKHGVV